MPASAEVTLHGRCGAAPEALREARGWTQGALADRLDVSRQTVNALETGRHDPRLGFHSEPNRALLTPTGVASTATSRTGVRREATDYSR